MSINSSENNPNYRDHRINAQAIHAEQIRKIEGKLLPFIQQITLAADEFYVNARKGKTNLANKQWNAILSRVSQFCISLHQENLLLNLHSVKPENAQDDPDDVYIYLTAVIAAISNALHLPEAADIKELMEHVMQQLVPYIDFDERNFKTLIDTAEVKTGIFLN